MSAFLVSKHHIDALVTAAQHGPSGQRLDHWTPVKLGQLDPTAYPDLVGRALWLENVASLEYRYPGAVDEWEEAAAEAAVYHFTARPIPLTLVEAIKAADCLDYQSCEHPTWEESDACKFLLTLKARLASSIPGYSDAQGWSIDSPDPRPRPRRLESDVRRCS